MTMFWEAGQQRTTRQARERMGEVYVAVRDAYSDAQVLAGVWTRRGAYQPPSYLAGERPQKTAEDLFRDFSHLVKARQDH